jgi:hypothetical protein
MPTANENLQWRRQDVVFAVSVMANLVVVLVMLYVCLQFNAHLYPFHPLTFPFVLVVEGFAIVCIATCLRLKRSG